MRRRALGIVVVLAGCSGDPPATSGLEPGEIIGRIEISEDVPATMCRVLLDGSPLGSSCDAVGGFDIRGVVPGRWDLRVIANLDSGLPARVLPVAANPGFVTDLGPIRLAKPGSIGGRVIGADNGIVVLPTYGIVTAPNANGGYLLTEVPPGLHDVVLITDDGTVVRAGVNVTPDKTTIQVDLDASAAVDVNTEVNGFALRAGLADGGHGDLTVELLDAVTGNVESATTTDSHGAFAIPAGSGIYVLRARDGDSPITAIIPSVVPRGDLPLTLASPMVVYPLGGDLDADGTDDDDDPDIDNDGVPNEGDAFPYDPAETQDVDEDGLGDRADIATQGPGVDVQNDTPDVDGDGLFQFEDNCELVANAGQEDADGDTRGDVCDNCRFEPNEDQQDSVGDGIGDVCRACAGSEDCPLGATCQQGRCVACTTDSQCGGEVCRDGACVPCTATETCSGDLVCNEPIGFCQDCLVNLDCDPGAACVAGHCFAGCSVNEDCGVAAFCEDFACVECRSNADCPGSEWCDAGLCQPECSVDANCSGGRICDDDTRTCVLPCSAGCPTGQTCDLEGVCRQTCDGSFPCPGGLTCNLSTNECEPECTMDVDCTDAFEECQLGECVPNGDCALDSDCDASAMCNTFGTCISRPTAFDPTAGAYLCTGACDCKLGETCDGTGHCAADGVPTRFVQAGASGNGLSITAPSGDFRTTITSLPADAHVAVRAGDTFASDGAMVSVTAPGVRIQGGYVLCSTTRWVRDAAQTSTITNANPNFGFIDVNGNFAFPTSDVTIGGLTLQHGPTSSGTRVMIDAIYAPRLHVHDLVTIESVPSGNLTMVRIVNSPDVLVERVSAASLQSTGGNTRYFMVELSVSDGLVRDVTVGPILDVWSFDGVIVSDATGPTTVERVTTGPMQIDSSGSNGVRVQDTATFPVTVRDVHVGAIAARPSGGGPGSVVHVIDSGNVAVSGVTTGSPGFIDPVSSLVLSHVIGVWFENSSGSVSDSDLSFERVTSAAFVIGYRVTGPAGAVTLTDNAFSGQGGPSTRMIEVDGVTTGTTVVDGGSFILTDGGATEAVGLYVDDASVVATDASFQLAGSSVNEYGAFVTGSAATRIERTRLLPGGVAGVTSLSVGARVEGSANLELYDSWLRGGPTAGSSSIGLWLNGLFTARAIGNTIEGGGAINQPGFSVGVRCQEGGPVTVTFTSNLVDGGRAPSHFMVHDADDNDGDCLNPARWDRNYFSFRASGVQSPGNNEDADLIGLVNNNIVGNSVVCFDSAFPNDFRIAAGSPCIDVGVAGTRLDASPLTLDLLGGIRVLGVAADIGAQERQ